MDRSYIVGVDIGTYSAKGVLTQADGTVVAAHAVPYGLSLPRPGWAEHDADEIWWASLVQIVQRLLRTGNVEPRQIAAVGCSAIGPTMLPVDAHGRPLRPAILYGIDTRTTREIEELNELLGAERIFELSGNALSSQAIGPKILWFRKNEPHLFRQTHKVLSASSYLTFRLTGAHTIDVYTAAGFAPMFSIGRQEWDAEMCAPICDPALLPTPLWTTDVAGTVTRAAAEATGLAEGTPVIVGTTDAGAEAVSVGVTEPGETMLMYGTTLFMIQVLAEWKRSPALWSGTYCLPGAFTLQAGMATSAALTRWFRDNFGQVEREVERLLGMDAYELLAQAAADIPPGSAGLLVLPYFSGERTPIHDPHARGVIAGLTLSHTRRHLYRALLEGVGYGVRHNLEAMEAIDARPRRLVAVGGGAKNALWLQIVSDITGRPQDVPATTIGAAYGDAYLAGYGVGVFPDLTALKRDWVTIRRVVEPRPHLHALYTRYYTLYRQAYLQLAEQLHALADLGLAAHDG